MNFYDGTEVYLCSDTRYVTYKSKREERVTYTMEEVFEIEKYMNGPIVKSKMNLK